MKFLRVLLCGCLGMWGLNGPAVSAHVAGQPTRAEDLAHGGGCRKSSPPGQCCHMQKSTGKVHCH